MINKLKSFSDQRKPLTSYNKHKVNLRQADGNHSISQAAF